MVPEYTKIIEMKWGWSFYFLTTNSCCSQCYVDGASVITENIQEKKLLHTALAKYNFYRELYNDLSQKHDILINQEILEYAIPMLLWGAMRFGVHHRAVFRRRCGLHLALTLLNSGAVGSSSSPCNDMRYCLRSIPFILIHILMSGQPYERLTNLKGSCLCFSPF